MIRNSVEIIEDDVSEAKKVYEIGSERYFNKNN